MVQTKQTRLIRCLLYGSFSTIVNTIEKCFGPYGKLRTAIITLPYNKEWFFIKMLRSDWLVYNCYIPEYLTSLFYSTMRASLAISSRAEEVIFHGLIGSTSVGLSSDGVCSNVLRTS
jgi:hypothetical protein